MGRDLVGAPQPDEHGLTPATYKSVAHPTARDPQQWAADFHETGNNPERSRSRASVSRVSGWGNPPASAVGRKSKMLSTGT